MSADAPNVPWVRLNAATFHDARLIRAGFWGGIVWLAALTMAKLHGWRGGRIPKDEFDPPLIAHHLNAVTVTDVTRSLEEGTAALVRVGLLEEDGSYWQIKGWAKYQADKTNAERQERHRAKDAKEKGVTVSAGSNGSNGDGTGRTGRDVRDEETPLPPSGEGGSSASPVESNGHAENGNGRAAASRGADHAAVRAILTKLCATSQGCPPSREQLHWLEKRRALDGGTLPEVEFRMILRDYETRYAETARAARAEVRRQARNARREAGQPEENESDAD